MQLRFLQVEPTTRCNYRCGFCAGRHLPQGDLDPQRLREFLAGIEGLEHVELQGEGEPLLHPRFFDLATAVRERFPAAGLSLITNGSLFSDEHIDGLLRHGFARVFVSMESADAERFRQIRGGRFERVAQGVAALMAERRRRNLALPTVGLAVTVLRDTVDEATDSVLPFYRAHALDGGITIQPLQPMPQYLRFYDAEMRAQLLQPAQSRRLQQRIAATPDLQAAMRERGRHPGFFEQLYGSVAGRPLCPWLSHGLFLGHDGAVVACCFVKDSARHALGRDRIDLAQVAQQRAALAGALAAGRVPEPCSGCGVAQRVAAAAPGAFSR